MPSLFDGLQKLPQAVRDHLYSEELEGWYSAAQDRWALPDDQRPEVEGAALDVYLRKRTLDQFIARLEEFVGDAGKARTIAIEILGNDFLKIEDYLGIDIPAYIKALGGNPSLFVKEIPVADVVRGVMGGIGVAPSDPVIVKRMEYAVTVFLTGVRDALETKDVLTKSTKVGGVGLDGATADRIVTALTAQLRELRDAGVIIRTETTRPPEASTFHLVKPSKSSVMQPEDEAEIEQLRQKIVPGDVVANKIRAAVDRVIQKTGAKFKSDDVSRRFRTAIESRVRDIRDYQETLDLLTRPSAQGGFGIPKEQVEKVLKVVEGEVRALHARTDGHGSLRVPAEALPRPSVASREGGAKAGMATDHGLPAPPPMVSPSPAPTTAITSQLVHPVPLKPQVASPKSQVSLPAPVAPRPPVPPPPAPPKPAVPPPPKPPPAVVPAAPATSVPPSPPRGIATPPDGHRGPRNDTQLAVAPPSAVKKIPIALPPPKSPSSKPLSPSPPQVLKPSSSPAPSGKPKMQDIRPVAPRLVGPVEELQQLTLQDFRKIAKAPADAATRIVEKLALLEKDSFTKRAEGVKVLRGSPLMAVYAEVMNAALIAKRSAEAELKERLAKDKTALTREEFQALGGLSAQIRL